MAATVTYPCKAYRMFEGDGMKMKIIGVNKADANYLTNGFAFTAAEAGMDVIMAIAFMGPSTTNVKDAYWNGTNIICFSDRGGTQVTNDTDISGQVMHFLVIGR